MPGQTIPVLETKRLRLCAPEAQDYPDFKATFASYRSRFMGGPLNAYEAWMLYAAEIGHWEIRGYGMWMIHLKDTGETVGMAGGWFPAKWPEREIAWIIWPEKSGNGPRGPEKPAQFRLVGPECPFSIRRAPIGRRIGHEGDRAVSQNYAEKCR